MKKILIIVAMLMAFVTNAEEPTNKERCQDWAVMDGIASEDMADYLKECLYNLEIPEEDLTEEEEIITADLDDKSPD